MKLLHRPMLRFIALTLVAMALAAGLVCLLQLAQGGPASALGCATLAAALGAAIMALAGRGADQGGAAICRHRGPSDR